MKGIDLKSCLRVSMVCLALPLSGCISLPNSPISPTPRFYALTPINGKKVGADLVSARIPGAIGDRLKAMIIGVGPVKIPEYLDRPQMVTKDKKGTLKFDEFNRWGESLDLGLARLIREDLTVMLPGAKLTLYPWNPSIAVKYQVVAEVVQLDSELDRDMSLVMQWTVIDVQNSKTVIIKRSEFRRAIIPHDYSGLAKTLSRACASLSSQIATVFQ
jgi:hypothetical protein